MNGSRLETPNYSNGIKYSFVVLIVFNLVKRLLESDLFHFGISSAISQRPKQKLVLLSVISFFVLGLFCLFAKEQFFSCLASWHPGLIPALV